MNKVLIGSLFAAALLTQQNAFADASSTEQWVMDHYQKILIENDPAKLEILKKGSKFQQFSLFMTYYNKELPKGNILPSEIRAYVNKHNFMKVPESK